MRDCPGPEFKLTADHIKLLRRANVGWNDAETGAPEIDPKRPYGNSDVAGDVCEILGWRPEGCAGDDDGCYTEEQRDRALALHRETETALQIILQMGEMTPGTFRQTDRTVDHPPRRHPAPRPRRLLRLALG